ncbi:IS66 family insertion sequence element accessory protein TnpA [Paenibacillus agri]|uniref:IS66 family insertion sequence element accessory protein TnpA n=1 Tax=Paenibacillus agri TaxID=2744309 RepID=UPI00406BAE38
MKAWCTEHNLTLHQLKYWLYKAQKQEQTVSATTFRPVAVASLSGTSTMECLQVQVGVVQINFRLGFEPGLLRDVVPALIRYAEFPLCFTRVSCLRCNRYP